MLIGQLARESNVSVRSIRYYESKGLIRSQRLANGYREYGGDAVQQVKIIKACLGLGFSLGDIYSILGCQMVSEQALPRCDQALAMYGQRLKAVEEQIATLEEVRELLRAIVDEVL